MKYTLLASLLFFSCLGFTKPTKATKVCEPCKAAIALEMKITTAYLNPVKASRIPANPFDPRTIDAQFAMIEEAVTAIENLLKQSPFTEAHADPALRLLAAIIPYDVQNLVPDHNRHNFQKQYNSRPVLKARLEALIASGTICSFQKNQILEYMGLITANNAFDIMLDPDGKKRCDTFKVQ